MKSGFVEHLDASFERAVMEIDRNIRDSNADREAKRGLFSILFKKLGRMHLGKTNAIWTILARVAKDTGGRRNEQGQKDRADTEGV